MDFGGGEEYNVDGGIIGESAEDRVAREHREGADGRTGGSGLRVSLLVAALRRSLMLLTGFVDVWRPDGHRW